MHSKWLHVLRVGPGVGNRISSSHRLVDLENRLLISLHYHQGLWKTTANRPLQGLWNLKCLLANLAVVSTGPAKFSLALASWLLSFISSDYHYCNGLFVLYVNAIIKLNAQLMVSGRGRLVCLFFRLWPHL